MMGRQSPVQAQLFYAGFNLEARVRADHPLRQIAALVDFDFAYEQTADHYGVNGNVSVPPPLILKLMLLPAFYNVRSERELMVTLPELLHSFCALWFELGILWANTSVRANGRYRP